MPPEVAPAAPAVPASAAPAPPAAVAPAKVAAPRAVTIQKRYPTKVNAIGELPRAARPAAPAAEKAPAAPPIQATAEAATEAATPAAPGAVTGDAAGISKEEPTPGAAPAATPPDAATLSAAELAKRTARLHRESRKLQEQRQAFERQTSENKQALERVKLVDQLRQVPKGQRLDVLRRAVGWQPQELVDEIIGEAARTPEQVQAAIVGRTMEDALAPYRREIEEGRKAVERERQAVQVEQYKTAQILPVIADQEAYKLSHRKHGTALPQVIYDTQLASYSNRVAKAKAEGRDPATVQAPTPKEVAGFIEKQYRDDYEETAKLLGQSVKTQQAAAPAAGSPIAVTKDPATRSPQQNPVFRRSVGKPYVTKMV
jgi:hypothetical protein